MLDIERIKRHVQMDVHERAFVLSSQSTMNLCRIEVERQLRANGLEPEWRENGDLYARLVNPYDALSDAARACLCGHETNYATIFGNLRSTQVMNIVYHALDLILKPKQDCSNLQLMVEDALTSEVVKELRTYLQRTDA